jgi:hypothetical protein
LLPPTHPITLGSAVSADWLRSANRRRLSGTKPQLDLDEIPDGPFLPRPRSTLVTGKANKICRRRFQGFELIPFLRFDLSKSEGKCGAELLVAVLPIASAQPFGTEGSQFDLGHSSTVRKKAGAEQ